MKFRPLHDRVVIERIDAEAKTAGGIIIPDTAQEKPQQGKVIAVGQRNVYLKVRISLVTPDSICATRPRRAGVKMSAGSRHRFGSAMDWYSIRFANGRISPNLDPQVCDCWLDTTGELCAVPKPL